MADTTTKTVQTTTAEETQNFKKGTLYIVGAALFWSTSGVLIKLIPWNAMAIAGLRSLFALIFSLIVIKDRKIRFTRCNILGSLCMCAATYFYIIAVKMTAAANAIVLQYTAPVFIVIISALFLKKRTTRLDICAVAFIFCGIALFFFDSLGAGQMLGNFIGLLSGIGFAGVFICNSMKDSTPQQTLILAHALGCLIGLPFVFSEVTLQAVPWISIICLGVFQTGLAYFLLAKGSSYTPPLLASLISCIDPILNSLWVMLIIGERPGGWATAGITIVILGVILYNTLLGLKARKQGG